MAFTGQPEDAATLLETFTHDVASLPPELSHLLSEISHKDAQITAFRDEISKRDAQLQKWVRINGGHVHNPKEEGTVKQCEELFDKCEVLQAEKEGLSEKALVVLERGIKRLDVGLRGLVAREEFPADWNGPSLLSNTGTGANTPIASGGTGVLRDVSGNVGAANGAGAGGPNIANAAQMRLQQTATSGGGRTSGQQTPTAQMARSQRESSAETSKRRRLNPSLGNLPTASSHLRQSSLGPGTPKAGTPAPTSGTGTSRAGSAQPARPAAGNAQKKGATAPAPQQGKKLAPPGAAGNNNKKRIRTSTSNNKKGDRRRHLARDRATPSTNASGSDSERTSASPTPSSLPRSQQDGASDTHGGPGPGPGGSGGNGGAGGGATNTNHSGRKSSRHPELAAEDEEDYEEENDDQLYCYCQKVSYGDMVGCDNDECAYQWFHWDCVGVKSEPKGEWLCPTCRELPRSKIRISKDE
ncbi:hypothetical protein KC340_g12385 [Hortaea werneckii]|nr:hypothetical protein KC342_g12699 [Hortaea werneckii]KAI7075465.1 hypothetical protein KC339_g13958 [Hortaea werneckii]KAI7222341.1 hypothetical protein KC365_g11413 [Hortaea werneckii]KAI7303880.1 hypothetical protein KC340_g12385 [Hortaea werneckii]KAI7387274.1 hypothetical protein KC328_g9519 [Hortaea werneckii]